MDIFDTVPSSYWVALLVISLINIVMLIFFKTNILYLSSSIFFIYILYLIYQIIIKQSDDWITAGIPIIIFGAVGIFFSWAAKARINTTKEF